jgi:hypothetical protein
MQDIHEQLCTSFNEVQDINLNWITYQHVDEHSYGYTESEYQRLTVGIPCVTEFGPLIAFYRERTDDPNRKQYDLLCEHIDYDGQPSVRLLHVNLYEGQCDRRVKEIIQQTRIDNE